MNLLILGTAGFIGTNLAVQLAENIDDKITLVDKSKDYFFNIKKFNFSNAEIKESTLDENMDFSILEGKDVVYHLVSTNDKLHQTSILARIYKLMYCFLQIYLMHV